MALQDLKNELVNGMADPVRKFSVKKFSEDYGVKQRRVLELMEDESIQRRVKEKVKKIIGGGWVLSKIYRKVVQSALHGSFKHQKLLLEITGEYSPTMRITPDMASYESKLRELMDVRTKALEGKPITPLQIGEPTNGKAIDADYATVPGK